MDVHIHQTIQIILPDSTKGSAEGRMLGMDRTQPTVLHRWGPTIIGGPIAGLMGLFLSKVFDAWGILNGPAEEIGAFLKANVSGSDLSLWLGFLTFAVLYALILRWAWAGSEARRLQPSPAGPAPEAPGSVVEPPPPPPPPVETAEDKRARELGEAYEASERARLIDHRIKPLQQLFTPPPPYSILDGENRRVLGRERTTQGIAFQRIDDVRRELLGLGLNLDGWADAIKAAETRILGDAQYLTILPYDEQFAWKDDPNAKRQWHLDRARMEAGLSYLGSVRSEFEQKANIFKGPGGGPLALDLPPREAAEAKAKEPFPEPYKRAALELKPPEVSKMSDGHAITDVEIALKIEGRQRLQEGQIWLGELRCPGKTEALDALVRIGKGTTFQIAAAGRTASVVLVHRNLADLISCPPFVLLTDRGDYRLEEDTQYHLDLELRSEAKYPTKVTLLIHTGVGHEADAAIVSQTV